ncbi:MAG: hypothetical protein LBK26_04700 [Rickettsiales bacterium]|jgi:hypothetical protein|nr:hypothetical protein [Rickettsiales bacterium]
MTDNKAPDIFSIRLTPRLVALETYAELLSELEKSPNKSPNFRGRIELARDMIKIQTDMYKSIDSLRLLDIIAPDSQEDMAKMIKPIASIVKSLEEMNR